MHFHTRRYILQIYGHTTTHFQFQLLYGRSVTVGRKNMIGDTCKGSRTLLASLYNDAGTPANECSPTKF